LALRVVAGTQALSIGNVQRGTGILNNELYIGRIVWNRPRYVKEPDTGRRVSRLNNRSEWVEKEVPHLRIISDEMWRQTKERQATMRARVVEPAFMSTRGTV
jgi:hypothetical protein